MNKKPATRPTGALGQPPRWAQALLNRLAAPHLLEELQGDMNELFHQRTRRYGYAKARRLYVWDLLRLLHPRLWRSQPDSTRKPRHARFSDDATPVLFHPTMIRNYLMVAGRNLTRHKGYSLINVLGLALGMGCGLIIFTLVNYHLSFDNFQPDADRVFRVVTDLRKESLTKIGAVPTPLGKALRQEYTFAKKVGRVVTFGGLISLPASAKNKKFQEPEGVAYAEPAFLDIMNFGLLKGDRKTSLQEPNTALLTKKTALKYFGQQNPIGQRFQVDGKEFFTVTGVLDDLPSNTDRRQEIYLSYATLRYTNPWLDDNSWGNIYGGSSCFVLLDANASETRIALALKQLAQKHYTAQEANEYTFKLQPMADVHFNLDYGGYIEKGRLITLALIGIFLLVTACVNFINLATAQALNRSKEIGVRKVLGSHRSQLFWQFMVETTLITLIALVVGLGLAYLVLPYVDQLFHTRLISSLRESYHVGLFIPLLLLLIIFASGAYPGLILSGFQPIKALKGKVESKRTNRFSVRNGLAVLQFTVSQILIIGAIVITSQLLYSKQANVGFDKETIVILPVPNRQKISALTAQLSSTKGVEKVTFFNAAPSYLENNWNANVKYDSRPEEEKFKILLRAGDANYVSTFGLILLAGRNLLPSDSIREYLLNEVAVRKLHLRSVDEALGKKLVVNDKEGTVVGIVRNFHNQSFRATISPLCLTTSVDHYFNCAVKVDSKRVANTLSSIEKEWTNTFPEYVYSYEFLDDHIAKFYALDIIILQLIWSFAGVAIFISCLGLYGLVSYMAVRKTKEIGVRKVLGASMGHILWLFGKEFSQLVLLAFLIAAPIGGWITRQYLQDFQFKIQLGPQVFLLAVGLTFVIALLTVGYRSVKAALVNPTKSLRSE